METVKMMKRSGGEGGPGYLDHGPELVIHSSLLLLHDLLGHRFQQFPGSGQFVDVADQRYHYLRSHREPFSGHVDRGLDDGPGLHTDDPRHHEPQTNAP